MTSRHNSSYAARLFAYLAAATVGSAVGSMLTWTSDTWRDANPLTAALPAVAFSLGPAILIAAAARLSAQAMRWLCASAAMAMVLMWWAFATNDSSTSSLVFLWGWIAGVPGAVILVVGARRFRRWGSGFGR